MNTIRLQYPVDSQPFKKEETLLRTALEAMKQTMTEELVQPRLHHQQKAVLKSLNTHWAGLTVFIDHPVIPMDNNGSERTLRNPVIGRKNYYGSGTEWSARLTAMLFSIFETLKLWQINPVEWLSDYFRSCALAGGMHGEQHAEHATSRPRAGRCRRSSSLEYQETQ